MFELAQALSELVEGALVDTVLDVGCVRCVDGYRSLLYLISVVATFILVLVYLELLLKFQLFIITSINGLGRVHADTVNQRLFISSILLLIRRSLVTGGGFFVLLNDSSTTDAVIYLGLSGKKQTKAPFFFIYFLSSLLRGTFVHKLIICGLISLIVRARGYFLIRFLFRLREIFDKLLLANHLVKRIGQLEAFRSFSL